MLNKEEKEERMRLYKAGCTDVEIAQHLGVTRSAILFWRNNNHLKTNRDMRSKHNRDAQLCWNCQNTNRYKCSWFDPDNPQPVEGWTAVPTKVKCCATNKIYETPSYHITECPNFISEEVSS